MNKTKFERIIKVTMDVCLGLIIVVAVALAFGPQSATMGTLVQPPKAVEVDTHAVEKLAKTITVLPPAAVEHKLRSADGKPTLLVIYASWCPYCRQLVPTLLSLKDEGALANIHLFFISIDKDKMALAQYIAAHRYQSSLAPYMVDTDAHTAFADMLSAKGSYFSGQIPYSVLFDSKGKLVAELPGLKGKEQILEVIEKTRK